MEEGGDCGRSFVKIEVVALDVWDVCTYIMMKGCAKTGIVDARWTPGFDGASASVAVCIVHCAPPLAGPPALRCLGALQHPSNLPPGALWEPCGSPVWALKEPCYSPATSLHRRREHIILGLVALLRYLMVSMS